MTRMTDSELKAEYRSLSTRLQEHGFRAMPDEDFQRMCLVEEEMRNRDLDPNKIARRVAREVKT